ncbi:MAG: trigger factor [Acidimicrobiales bacterium]
MKATVEPLEGNKVKLTVEVDEAEFDKAIDAAFRKIAREVRIPGFRPGKAPRKVLERRLGAEVGREQALQDSLPDFYAQALSDHDVDPIASPDIDITAGKDAGPLAFDAVVEVRPEVTVPGYDGLRITLERPEVPEDDVDARIDRMRQVQATLAEVDRPAIDDDVVTIDIAGTLDGEPQDGLSADDYSYTVGSDMVTPEVDVQLRGAKAGDILSFEATHPDEDEERQLEFRILVKEVNQRVLPDADDTWAAESSEFDTIADLRDSIRRQMTLLRKVQGQSEIRQKAGEALAALVAEDAPPTLVEHETRHRLQDMAMRVSAQGIDPQTWLQSQIESPSDGIVGELRTAAATAVKVDLALRAVADAENVECTDDDVDAEIALVAERVDQKPKRVREQFERGGQLPGVRSEIRTRKALDWLVEQVEIVDIDGQPIERSDFDVDAAEFDRASPGSSIDDPDQTEHPEHSHDAADTDETEIDDTETEVP